MLIVIDTQEINQLALRLKGFEPQVVKAAQLSLQRTTEHIITVTAREVSKVYNVKASDLKRMPRNVNQRKAGGAPANIRVQLPTISRLEASITYTGRTLSMAHFSVRPQQPFPVPNRRSKEVPVKVKIKRDGGFKMVHSSPKPFVFRFPTNIRLNVWKRIGRSFYPIEPIRTLSIPQMITNAKVEAKIIQAANEMLGKRLDHEITRLMTSKQRVYRS